MGQVRMYLTAFNGSLCLPCGLWYCSDATSHSQGHNTRVRVKINASDQTKSFELREFT